MQKASTGPEFSALFLLKTTVGSSRASSEAFYCLKMFERIAMILEDDSLQPAQASTGPHHGGRYVFVLRALTETYRIFTIASCQNTS